ncbi:MAG: HNH endonuclease [Verrucomicrobiaceae bacterium]|nr:HNH endonuclease [Verrucomicrobiaceae bacterium]
MQDEIDAAFHIEHIVAKQHRGPTIEENLALACSGCNLHKGTNLFSLDPDTNQPVRLFDPRKDRWEDHFRRVGARILGITGVGRTTAWLLQFNSDLNLLQRQAILDRRALD